MTQLSGSDLAQQIDSRAALERIQDLVQRTPLVAYPSGDPRIELRLKLECLQETNSFKSRGASNQIALLTAAERAQGVVAVSSGNHGRALAWAARRAGVPATICMPADAYSNKIEACRAEGAEVELARTRAEAEARCRALQAAGAVFVPPYDHVRTIEGAGTVGVELAQDWPQLEVVVIPVGGGGLLAGTALALSRELPHPVRVLGVEPAGAPGLGLGLAAGQPVPLAEITTRVQGLCPPSIGAANLALARWLDVRGLLLDDDTIHAAQARLVRGEDGQGGWTVEPAGAAAPALVLAGQLPPELLEGRSAADPLRVVAIVSGGNPDPAQLAGLRQTSNRESQPT